MPATYQFLRFVTPGLVFIIEVAIFLAVGHAGLGWTEWLWKRAASADVGDAITAFILSGGIGYLVSMVHHLFLYRVFGPDFSDLAEEISTSDSPTKRDPVPREASGLFRGKRKGISRSEGWRVVTVFWHSRRETWPTLKGATQRAETLADLMHGAGSSLAASLLATLIGGLSLLAQLGLGMWHMPNVIAAGLIALVFIVLHSWSFYITVQNTEGFVSQVLQRAIKEHAQHKDLAPMLGAKSL